jgi:hypothetical protein
MNRSGERLSGEIKELRREKVSIPDLRIQRRMRHFNTHRVGGKKLRLSEVRVAEAPASREIVPRAIVG